MKHGVLKSMVITLISTLVWIASTPGEGVAKKTPKWWPRGKVFVPKRMFKKTARKEIDQQVRNANPRLYLYPDYDESSDKIMVIGMPGWGGRSENFIWTLVNGLKEKGLTSRLIIAAIQDTRTGGPRYQGQGDREHANVWSLDKEGVQVMRRFVEKIGRKVGHLRVYMLGFSSGGIAAPLAATRIARWTKNDAYTVEGSICMGTGSRVTSGIIKVRKQRVLFVVVPKLLETDPKPMRDDQRNRLHAERSFNRLNKQGAPVYLRHIQSAKRHIDWHWGLISQCRYFRTKRIDPGRGYWPNYWMPNPETSGYIRSFIQGQAPPPETATARAQTTCPY